MAIDSSLSLTAFVLFVLMLCLPLPSVAVPSEELEIAISVLRLRGRALFANAITTSDILFDLLSAESLTLLVPTDAMLFDLDMRYSLPMYISTLRLHALPLRLTISELRSLPNASSVPTFLPSHLLLLTKPIRRRFRHHTRHRQGERGGFHRRQKITSSFLAVHQQSRRGLGRFQFHNRRWKKI
ncbi:unnamed protein product [Brassica rapa subsp. trilocularis]